MGDYKQPEEAIHIAAAILAAGFKSVVATMWSIPDNTTPIVVERFYSHFLKDGTMRGDKAAEALHYAVQHLRTECSDFTSWMPFIHLGA